MGRYSLSHNTQQVAASPRSLSPTKRGVILGPFFVTNNGAKVRSMHLEWVKMLIVNDKRKQYLECFFWIVVLLVVVGWRELFSLLLVYHCRVALAMSNLSRANAGRRVVEIVLSRVNEQPNILR